jgi:hypothetical protein
MHYHTQLFVEMGSCKLFAKAGLEPLVFQISTFQVARIAGVNHQRPVINVFFHAFIFHTFYNGRIKRS